MSADPNTPVIVGAAAVHQRVDDPVLALEPLALIRAAFESAAADAGSNALLDAASVVLLTQGMWASANPAQVAAPWNPDVRSVVADLGVLQQTLIDRACTMVASGEADVVLVGGGEAKYRSLRSQITGIPVVDTVTAGAPSERLTPDAEIITAEEIARGLPVPARQYAMIDTALRAAQGLTPTEHIDVLADLQQRFSDVAAGNPSAWGGRWRPDAAMLAWPYTKLHCSQWNVDQAAGIIVCNVAAAERFGIDRNQWVFAHLGIESNLMVPLSHRAELHRSPAAAIAGRRVPAGIEHLDLYSCFPAAVRVQAAELGIDPTRQLTVTGGMTFAGGPLNNSSLQALVKMVEVLRADPGSRGMVTNISGMLTKFGLSVWSTSPPSGRFEAADITDEVRAETRTVPFDPDHVGPATVATYTVVFDHGRPVQGIVLADTAEGRRVLATTTDPVVMADMTNTDWCGRHVVATGPTFTT
ncbi:MAG: acetyl-CoA acetyltransferase [Ilumatobacteraceae bacterium]